MTSNIGPAVPFAGSNGITYSKRGGILYSCASNHSPDVVCKYCWPIRAVVELIQQELFCAS